jgi:ubiquinone/menaquinone biosynthesis C-methylase UbiE
MIELKPKTWGGFWDIFGEVLVEILDIQEGDNVLDIGTGGGSVLYPLLRRVRESGKVTGVELCEHCAKATTAEIKRCKINNAEVHFMDARQAEFEDDSFDCITAGFIGWNDYFDFQSLTYKKPDELMAAICRLLKPNGKFGMSTWLMQEDLDWMYEFLTTQEIDCKKNYSIENEEGWRLILTEAGFHDIKALAKSASYPYQSVEFWWKEMMDYDWLVDGDNTDMITDSVKKLAYSSIQNRLVEGGRVPFTREAIFVTATYGD